MSGIIWSGLIVVDRFGRPVMWQGSHTPKLYRAEEQAKYSLSDGQRLEAVDVVIRASGQAAMIYKPKVCRAIGCGETFVPRWARQIYCPSHETKRKSRAQRKAA